MEVSGKGPEDPLGTLTADSVVPISTGIHGLCLHSMDKALNNGGGSGVGERDPPL